MISSAMEVDDTAGKVDNAVGKRLDTPGQPSLVHPRRIVLWGWKAGAWRPILLAMNEIRPPLPVDEPQSDPGLTEFRPTVIVAPELRGRRDFLVIREPDETDEDYQSRCELVALLLNYAEKG
jgi:hypothetical protein